MVLTHKHLTDYHYYKIENYLINMKNTNCAKEPCNNGSY
jgi:ribosomal protein S27AE